MANQNLELWHKFLAGEIEGKYVNGVDMITFGEDGKIVEFKVMIRPLQAINLMHEKMRAMLETLSSGSH